MIVPNEETMSLPVTACARCGENHDAIKYRRFQRPVVDDDGTVWDWWGTCPTNGDPILMHMGYAPPEVKYAE